MCSRSFFAMSPRVSRAKTITYIRALLVMLTHYMIDPAKGHCTVTIQGCEKGDAANGTATELKEIRNQQDILIANLQAIDQRLKEQDTYNRQVQGIFEIFNASNQQMKNQPERLTTSLQTADLYLLEQVQSIYEFLNTSIQQMKNQPERLTTSLQTADLYLLEQVQSIYEFLNTSIQQLNDQHHIVMINFQEINRSLHEQDTYIKQIESDQQMNNQQESVMTSLRAVERLSLEQSTCSSQVQSISALINASFQQTQNQQVSAMASLVAIDRRLKEHDIFVRNKTDVILELDDAFGTDDWMVIMHRFDGSVTFDRTWAEYRNGFGDKEKGEFWLGNEEVHRLTNRNNCTLRIEVQPEVSGMWYYAEYSTFSLDSENNKYTLRLSGYSGNAGDSLINTSLYSNWYQGDMMFSTSDSDNDRSIDNCAEGYAGGWWFNHCHTACLTCRYPNYFKWYNPIGWPTSGRLQAARLMIKSK